MRRPVFGRTSMSSQGAHDKVIAEQICFFDSVSRMWLDWGRFVPSP